MVSFNSISPHNKLINLFENDLVNLGHIMCIIPEKQDELLGYSKGLFLTSRKKL